MTPTLEAQFKECERELAMRRNVYRNSVTRGQLTQELADARIALMEAIKETVRKAMMDERMTGLGGKRIE
jgi:hypothetical protein